MSFVSELSGNKVLDLRAPSLTQLRKRAGAIWLRKTTLIAVDGICLGFALEIAQAYNTSSNISLFEQNNSLFILSTIAIQICLIATQGLYEAGEKRRDYSNLTKTITFSYFLLILFEYLYLQNNFFPRETFVTAWLLSIAITCSGRFMVNTAIMRLRKQNLITCPTYLICSPQDKQKAIKLLDKQNCYNIVGWKNVDLIASSKGHLSATLDDIINQGVAEVFVCSWQSIQSRMYLYWKLRNAGVILHILPIELQAVEQRLELKMIGGIPILNFMPPTITGSDFWIKRYFDFCSSALFILFTSPIYLLIALLIKFDSPGPVFYKQTRIGLHGKSFQVWKFRTMVTNADALQKELEARNETKDGILFKIKDDPRITRIGNFLRRYSLDELPQLFNVLFGEMSLVGPRPLPVRDVQKFSDHHFIRQEVLPGITGLWQISGRSDILDFEKVIDLDKTYMENWSLSLDLQIILQTITVILEKKGAY
ncbi:sugar transferase [Rivularia sp. UHCC 0363]|uniref:sugar transferase n=1 Tax=Rivularia sp. UHCC 0363 TaxID=3110244 RepID=UPI002B21C806|nr:sugar transferase [Rivularia sp. UHCC 0363]MEA5593105.1 sugar transferase [Rivularia sp. UHCC 0363]